MIKQKQQGQIMIVAIVFMAIALTLVSSLIIYTLLQIKAERQAVGRIKALSIAEAGIEQAVYKLNKVSGYTGESNIAYGEGTFTTTITTLSGNSKLVTTDAYIPSSSNPTYHRTVQVTVTLGTSNISFRYGVQVGEGGLKMDNNSAVNGNVYSNGDVTGQITGTTFINGDAYAVDSIDHVTIQNNSASHYLNDSIVGGNADIYDVKRTKITGDVSANSLTGTPSDCQITGNAMYNSLSGCTIGGTATTPNPSVPTDPAVQPFPVSDAQILAWEQEAENGGVVGSQTISGNVSLGPIKINGNLTVSNNSTLNMTGNIWVTGTITLSNGSTVKLDPSYGDLSGVLIAGLNGDSSAGYININNIASILGSGNAGSFTMVISLRTGTSSNAIQVANNAAGAIIYAPYGLVDVVNNAQLKEVSGYQIHLNNNSVINYDSGLANSNFSAGPGAGWQMADQSWQLLR